MTTKLTTGFSFSWDTQLSDGENLKNWDAFVDAFNLRPEQEVQYIHEDKGVASHSIYTVQELDVLFGGMIDIASANREHAPVEGDYVDGYEQ